MRKTYILLFLLLCSPAWGADVPVPVASDSRIKTFVYSENDVFTLVTHYGYESNIEFGRDEEVETISVGDRVGWQIVPAGRRLFVRAMMANGRTNMTVVTNKHAYQFDIVAVPAPVSPNDELAYVVRFYYPDDRKNAIPAVYTDEAMPSTASYVSAASAVGGYNYSYTYSGNEAIAPVKIYDDGKSTYFKFRSIDLSPTISTIALDGNEIPLTVRRIGDLLAVDAISARFALHQGGATVMVYNGKMSHP
jgi:type IV secretion system protein VirB9